MLIINPIYNLKINEDFQELAVNQLEVRLSKTKRACNADLAAVFRPVTPFGVKGKVPKNLLEFLPAGRQVWFVLFQDKMNRKKKKRFNRQHAIWPYR